MLTALSQIPRTEIFIMYIFQTMLQMVHIYAKYFEIKPDVCAIEGLNGVIGPKFVIKQNRILNRVR